MRNRSFIEWRFYDWCWQAFWKRCCNFSQKLICMPFQYPCQYFWLFTWKLCKRTYFCVRMSEESCWEQKILLRQSSANSFPASFRLHFAKHFSISQKANASWLSETTKCTESVTKRNTQSHFSVYICCRLRGQRESQYHIFWLSSIWDHVYYGIRK